MIDVLVTVIGVLVVGALVYGLYEVAWFLRDYVFSRKAAALQARLETQRVSRELSWLAWQARMAMREEVRRHAQDPDRQ